MNMYKYFGNKYHANIFLSSIANLERTPSDRQMYPWGYMCPRLGAPALRVWAKMLFIRYVYEKRCV